MKKILFGLVGVTALTTAAAGVLYRTYLKTDKVKFGEEPLKEWLDWAETIEYKDYYISSRDGLFLHGVSMYNNTDSWVILAHGYDSKWQGMLGYARMFYERGYSVFIPDQRGYGLSGDNETTMGHYERLDMIDWANMLIKDLGAQNIVMFGVSMGAATVMLMSGEKLPPQVKAFIEDCGYSSVKEEFEYNMKQIVHMPPYPTLLICSAMTQVRKGWSIMSDADCVKAVSRAKLPFLFIHGSADTFVPFFMLDKVFNACSSPEKEKLVVDRAKHTEAYGKAPELYEKTVFGFLERALNK